MTNNLYLPMPKHYEIKKKSCKAFKNVLKMYYNALKCVIFLLMDTAIIHTDLHFYKF